MIREKFNEVFITSTNDTIYDFELLNFSKNVVLKYKKAIPRLFRYSSADYYNIRALETQSLYLTPSGNMNDVFEGLSCEISDEVIDGIENISDIAFLKSFSEEKSSLLMWAHYADNYSGMCVEYDFSKLSETLLFHLYPVYYSAKRSTSRHLEWVIAEHKDLKRINEEKYYPNECDWLKDIMSLFLSKSMSWAYEKEWRILVMYPQMHNEAQDVEDELEEFYHIDSQQISVVDCVKAVYLGPKMKRCIKEHIKEICRDRLGGIPVYSTRLSKEKYALNYIQEE